MTTNQTIDGVPRADLETLLGVHESYPSYKGAAKRVRALLDAPVSPLSELEVLRAAVKELETMRDARVDAKLAQGEPVAFSAVGVLRDDGDGGLVPEWILEGGTAELWAGAVLLIADEDQELCAEDGHCELYRNPPEQPATVAVVPIQEDRETLIGYGRSSGLEEASTLCARLAYAAYYPPGTRFKAFTPKAQKALGDLLIKAANEIASLPGGPYERFKARQAKKAESAKT